MLPRYDSNIMSKAFIIYLCQKHDLFVTILPAPKLISHVYLHTFCIFMYIHYIRFNGNFDIIRFDQQMNCRMFSRTMSRSVD